MTDSTYLRLIDEDQALEKIIIIPSGIITTDITNPLGKLGKEEIGDNLGKAARSSANRTVLVVSPDWV